MMPIIFKSSAAIGIFSIFFSLISYSHAANKTVDLTVGSKTVNFAGENVQTVAINDQIPAPVLRFKEGDHVTINVHNNLEEGTAIHWHGVLLPWYMDGVEGVTQEAIPPGGSFSYSFTLRQSGTYWYHAHAGFQEQQGMYGGFIIEPKEHPVYHYSQDHVIVLSDWTNAHPDQVFANLKKDGDYYTPRFPLQPSLAKYLGDYDKASPEERKKLDDDYSMMQDMRMSIYDLSDVAYDAFLLNGKTKEYPWTAQVKVGDTVRLRFIGAGGSTIYHVKIPGSRMKVVHIQGHDIEPYDVDDFTIAPGETTDVLVKIEKDAPHIIYAESADSLGAAYGALLTQADQKVDLQIVQAFPEPQPISMMGHDMSSMQMTADEVHMVDHSKMNHEAPVVDHSKMDHGDQSSLTMGTKYQTLKSPVKTNDPNKPVQDIKMELSGYMGRFMWFINGLAEYEAEPIIIEPGKRYRITFTNSSMMIHPMHIHGHFFILRNGHGAYDPFLHTIEVAPGATVVADFDADESGQWFFHCHHLYHMMTGMSRVFRYSTFMDDYKNYQSHEKTPVTSAHQHGSEPSFVVHPIGHHAHLHNTTMIDLGYDPFHNVQKANFNFYFGWDRQKLQLYSEDAEIRKGKVESADLDIFYWHLLSEFWAVKGGANFVYKPAHKSYWQPGIGIEGLFPYFIATNLRTYFHEGGVKFDLQLSRDTQLSHNFFIKTGVRGVLASKSVEKDEIWQGLNRIEYIVRPYYAMAPGVSIFTEFDYTQSYGNHKKFLNGNGKSTRETVFMFGVAILY
jgi:FtsP/CotA-like multicopper oxidase with cupredoxin domain